jgi:hypothetical protein
LYSLAFLAVLVLAVQSNVFGVVAIIAAVLIEAVVWGGAFGLLRDRQH